MEADFQQFLNFPLWKMEDQLQGSSEKAWKLDSFVALQLRTRLKTELMTLLSWEQNQLAIQMREGIWLSVFRNTGIQGYNGNGHHRHQWVTLCFRLLTYFFWNHVFYLMVNWPVVMLFIQYPHLGISQSWIIYKPEMDTAFEQKTSLFPKGLGFWVDAPLRPLPWRPGTSCSVVQRMPHPTWRSSMRTTGRHRHRLKWRMLRWKVMGEVKGKEPKEPKELKEKAEGKEKEEGKVRRLGKANGRR